MNDPRQTDLQDWNAAARARARRSEWPGRRLSLATDFSLPSLAERRDGHDPDADPLTGLASRAHFRRRAAAVLANAIRSGDGAEQVAVLLLDLHGLRAVNDQRGQGAGDEVLVEAAERVARATRGSDVAARLGGDEFGVLLDGVRTDLEAIVVVGRILRAFERPFEPGGGSTAIGVSIGVARGQPVASVGPGLVSPAGGEGARPTAVSPGDALLRNAELALHEAKRRGAGAYVLFEAPLHAAVRAHLDDEATLRRAFERRELHLAYQPIVDLATGTLRGVEALLRWTRPDLREVSPTDFIPLAERSELIVPLGRWVVETAVRDAARWSCVAPSRAPSVTVNVSAQQLHGPGFAADVERALAEHRFPAERLVLELTESAVIDHPAAARGQLARLKQSGVRLALDDFGTGHSALASLQQFPFDLLKIDRSVVAPLAAPDADRALFGAIVALGSALGLTAIAEGVETVAQREAVRGAGCTLAQGLLLGRPTSAAAVEAQAIVAHRDADHDGRTEFPGIRSNSS